MASPGPTAADGSQRPLRRDAERNRVRILEAARDVFAEQGLTATLEAIANRAGVGVGTVYRRYPDKQELIDALFEDRIDHLVAVLDEALGDADAYRGFVRALEGMLELQAADRGLMELVVGGHCAGERTRVARERVRPRVERLLRRAQAEGGIRPDLEHGDMVLLQLTLGSLVQSTREVDPELWRRYLGLVVDGLRTQRPCPTRLHDLALSDERLEGAMRDWQLPR